MGKIEINELPASLTISGPNDYIPVDHNNGDGTFTTKKVRPNLVAGLSTVTTLTALEFIAGANVGYYINSGLQGYLIAPYSGEINGYTLVANIAGTLVFDIWKCNSSTFDASVTHPVLADSICGGSPPALTAEALSATTTLTGWTTTFNAGDIFAFSVNSTDGLISQLTLALSVTKTSIP